MENIFKCTFCEEAFNLNNKIPKMLTQCGHSICSECLENNLKNNKNIRCDIDDQIINTENTTQQDYPKNLALIQYLEQKNPHSLNDTLENINCQEYFANSEQQHDLQSTATDKKKILQNIKVMEELIQRRSYSDSFSEEENVNGFCQFHKINQDVFCETCERWICHKCGLFGEHKGHQMTNGECFKEKANNFCKEVVELLAKIEREENFMKDEFIEIFFASKSSKSLKKLHKQVRDQYKEASKKLKEQKEEVLKQIDSKIQECEEVLQEKIDEHIEKFNDRSSSLKRNLRLFAQEINRKKNKEKIYLQIQKDDSKIIQQSKSLAESLQIDIKILKRRITKFFEQFNLNLSQNQQNPFVLNQPDIDIIKGKQEQQSSFFITDNTTEEQDSILTLGKKGEKFSQFLPNDDIDALLQKKKNSITQKIRYDQNPFKNSQNDNSAEKKAIPVEVTKRAFVKKKIQTKQFQKQKTEKLETKPLENKASFQRNLKLVPQKNNEIQRCRTSHKVRKVPQAVSLKRDNSFIRKKSLFNSSKIKTIENNDKSLRSKLLVPRKKLMTQSQRRIKTSHKRLNTDSYESLFSTMKKQNQVLNFDDSNLKDSFLSKFNDYLKDSENVKVLILSNNQFTDQGVQKVCDIIKDMQIQTLDLSGNLLTRKSIQFLRQLCETNKCVKRIVFENSPLNKDQLEDLTAEFKSKGIEFQY